MLRGITDRPYQSGDCEPIPQLFRLFFVQIALLYHHSIPIPSTSLIAIALPKLGILSKDS